ncbi:MAG: hypothetical protein WD824_15800 [Cyclobacteriaceae bacterium]
MKTIDSNFAALPFGTDAFLGFDLISVSSTGSVSTDRAITPVICFVCLGGAKPKPDRLALTIFLAAFFLLLFLFVLLTGLLLWAVFLEPTFDFALGRDVLLLDAFIERLFGEANAIC